MKATKEVEMVLDGFIKGNIPVDELLLHVEPILVGSAHDRAGQDEVRKIVNAIERTIYTQNEPARSNEIIEWLRNAVAFVRSQHCD